MASLDCKVKVRIETDVIMDVGLMAKAFAQMDSDAQAQFMALAHQEMEEYTRSDGTRMGEHGRELQMLHVKDHFDEHPRAQEFIEDFFEMCCGDDVEESTSRVETSRPIGRIISINPADGTAEVLMDPPQVGGYIPAGEPAPFAPEQSPFKLHEKQKCDCGAKEGEFHFHGCPQLEGRPRPDYSKDPVVVAAKDPCGECGGSGFWTNPAGGRNAKSPCSKGCPPNE